MICRALNLSYPDDDWPAHPGAAVHRGDAIRRLSQVATAALRKSSGIAFAKRAGFEAVLGAHAARLVIDRDAVPLERTAVIFAGAQGHIQTAIGFAERGCRFGAAMVDPLSFPSVLPSFAPTAIAAALGTRGPAFTVGHGERAFLDSLDAAAALVRMEMAQAALVIAVADGAPWRGCTETSLACCAVAAWLAGDTADELRQRARPSSKKLDPAAHEGAPGPVLAALAFAGF